MSIVILIALHNQIAGITLQVNIVFDCSFVHLLTIHFVHVFIALQVTLMSCCESCCIMEKDVLLQP